MKRFTYMAFGSVAVAAALTLSGCSSGAASNQSASGGSATSVVIAASPSIFSLDVHYAIDKGIFKKNGINAKIVAVQSPADASADLANGDVQFAQFDIQSALLADSQGQGLTVTVPVASYSATTSTKPHGFGSIIVAAKGSIHSPKDLQGKTIGIAATNGSSYLDMVQRLTQLGVNTAKIKWVVVPSPQQLTAVKQGQIDAAATAEPFVSSGIASGAVRAVLSADGVLPNAPQFGLASTKKWATANAGTVNKVSAAILEANREIDGNRASALKELPTYAQIDPAALKILVLPSFTKQPFTKAGVQQVANRLVKFGLIKQSAVPPLDQVVSNLK